MCPGAIRMDGLQVRVLQYLRNARMRSFASLSFFASLSKAVDLSTDVSPTCP